MRHEARSFDFGLVAFTVAPLVFFVTELRTSMPEAGLRTHFFFYLSNRSPNKKPSALTEGFHGARSRTRT